MVYLLLRRNIPQNCSKSHPRSGDNHQDPLLHLYRTDRVIGSIETIIRILSSTYTGQTGLIRSGDDHQDPLLHLQDRQGYREWRLSSGSSPPPTGQTGLIGSGDDHQDPLLHLQDRQGCREWRLSSGSFPPPTGQTGL